MREGYRRGTFYLEEKDWMDELRLGSGRPVLETTAYSRKSSQPIAVSGRKGARGQHPWDQVGLMEGNMYIRLSVIPTGFGGCHRSMIPPSHRFHFMYIL